MAAITAGLHLADLAGDAAQRAARVQGHHLIEQRGGVDHDEEHRKGGNALLGVTRATGPWSMVGFG